MEGSRAQVPLTLIKPVLSQAGLFSLSIWSASQGQAGSLLNGGDSDRKTLGQGGEGPEAEATFLTRPC